MKGRSFSGFQFGPFEVDVRARVLRKTGIKIRLQEQPFQVLVALLEAKGDIVSREDLRERLWPRGTFVEFDRGLNTAVKKIRAALCDDAVLPRYIETIPRRGYRFLQPVNTIDIPETRAARRRTVEPATVFGWLPWIVSVIAAVTAILLAAYLGEKFTGAQWRHIPTLAVLPLSNMGQTSNQARTARLSRMLSIEMQRQNPAYVILSGVSSSRANGAAARQSKESIDYVLQGGVLQDGTRMHVSIQLVQMSDQSNLFAHEYEREWNGSASEEELVADIVSQLQPTLTMLSANPR